jgi:hypothetical protein
MADQLADGRSVRTLNILDSLNREGLCVAWQATAEQTLRVDMQQRTAEHGNRRNYASTKAQTGSINSTKTPRKKWGIATQSR